MRQKKYLIAYTAARPYRGTLGTEVNKWQRTKEAQAFIKKAQGTETKYKLRVRDAGGGMGKGLYTLKGISQKGLKVGLYAGELTNNETVKNVQGDYLIDFPYFEKYKGVLLDAEQLMKTRVDHWNVAHANHSCEKYNCILIQVKVGNGTFLVLQTLRKIKPGEQLLFDYDEGSVGHPYWEKEEYAGQAKELYGDRAMLCVCDKPCPLRRYRVKD